MNAKKLYTYLFVFLYWLVSINMLSFIAIASIKAFLSHINFDVKALNDPVAEYWISPRQYIESLLFSLFFSILYIAVHEVSDKFRWERLGFGRVIVIKSIAYLIGIIAICFLIYGVVIALGTFPKESFHEFVWSPEMTFGMTFVFLYVIFLLLVLNFIIQTNKMIGNYNLKSFLTGKYHRPINEDRIFLFIDLTSSTSYAEKLGSTKYSKLIKDCFDEINFLVDSYRAEIYQYVGDEIVLTWKTPAGLKNLNFLAVFFAFRNQIHKRKDYYLKHYGLVPEFKAGVNCGTVSVAEVGNIKRDIAFHGDVVNTTSRIQGVCNQFGKKLLISAQLVRRINGNNEYQLEFLGEHVLRGKHNKVGLYAVEESLTGK